MEPRHSSGRCYVVAELSTFMRKLNIMGVTWLVTMGAQHRLWVLTAVRESQVRKWGVIVENST